MSDQEKLEKIVQTAIDRGWDSRWDSDFIPVNRAVVTDDEYDPFDMPYPASMVLFDHKFVRALFGILPWYFTEEGEWTWSGSDNTSQYLIEMEAWQYHIHQAAIAPNPISYYYQVLFGGSHA